MVRANPRCSREHCNEASRHGDDAPSKDDLRDVLRDVVLEVTDDDEDEPRDAGDSGP